MKITIIYDNTAFDKRLRADWGFSALIEAGTKILFDTGANGEILLDNMKKLSIEPLDIDEVFISHKHWDHVGGLSAFLEINQKAKVYIPPSFSFNNAIVVGKAQKIHDNVFSTGELEGIEQSMGILTPKGIVLVVGCSHPNMKLILNTAKQFGKLYGIIGGLHGFSDFELFKDLKLICPTHCTQHKAEIRDFYPEQCVEGGAGQIIEINGERA
jgi:7,8-dihydropterin-6-yl-methyl-4-(beta-D-ribofuranosyl)aminobenzene 5'-phosphate synthase